VRQIVKGHEPSSFTAWKDKANSQWTPSYGVLQNPEKKDLLEHLIKEQGGTCCYCGRFVDSASAHIEHFRPQSKAPQLALIYENLFASCIRETKPGTPLHCGHLKDEWFDERLHVSPLDSNCESRFKYYPSGTIDGTDASSQEMVRVLGLNLPQLAAQRNRALAGVFDDAFIDSATEEELTLIATEFRKPSDGVLTSCFHVIARYAEQLLGI